MSDETVQEPLIEEDAGTSAADESVVIMSSADIVEMLEYQQQMEDDTVAVLGASNDKVCSYPEGYVKRQALYSCLTCIPENKEDPEKRAGFCLACSYDCHDGHELVELYTKRNFRCDCGNSKFPNNKCNLFPEKEPLNEENNYNQNFQGRYCVCSRRYPDPEGDISDEMIQCVICEDWYHSGHLDVTIPETPIKEMACMNCVKEHSFLLHYAEANKTEKEETSVNVETDITTEEKETTECSKPKNKAPESTLFWSDSWRNRMCTCDTCLELYGDENVLFLLDAEDPLSVYEEKGTAKAQEAIQDENQEFLSSLNRVAMVEMIAGYNEFKSDLAEFFNKFAEEKKVIEERDVKDFFEEMQAKKKQRTTMPYYCK